MPTNARTQKGGGSDAANGIVNSTTDKNFEPKSTYNPQYPYNKVIKTEGGHVLELDDTPNASRIRVYHKSGSYVEISEDGRIVSKCVGSMYEVVSGQHSCMISGSSTVQINGNVNMSVKGNMTHNVDGDFTHNVKGNYNLTAGNGMNIKGSTASITAGSIDLKNS